MTKEVMITIKGIQRYPKEEAVETVSKAKAEYYLRNKSHYVIFEEETEGFKEKTRSMLKLHGNRMELTRKGLVQSQMVFEENKTYISEYRTPFGAVPMGVHTRKFCVAETEKSIVVDIEYSLEANEEHMADCHIEITIRSQE